MTTRMPILSANLLAPLNVSRSPLFSAALGNGLTAQRTSTGSAARRVGRAALALTAAAAYTLGVLPAAAQSGDPLLQTSIQPIDEEPEPEPQPLPRPEPILFGDFDADGNGASEFLIPRPDSSAC